MAWAWPLLGGWCCFRRPVAGRAVIRLVSARPQPASHAPAEPTCLACVIGAAGGTPSPVRGLVQACEPFVAERVRAVIVPCLYRRGEMHDPRILDELAELRLVEGQRRLVGRLEVLGLHVPARVDRADPA